MDSQTDLLKSLIAEGEKFSIDNFSFPNPSGSQFCGSDRPEWLAWKTRISNLIKHLMANDSPAFQLLRQANSIRTDGNYKDTFEKAKSAYLQAATFTLEAVIKDTFGELRIEKSDNRSPALSNKVFIVHGHDQALKTDVEALLQQIGLEPVVLHRQPDKGQTIIEKFEEHSDVGYAIILLTPDEIAYTVDQERMQDESRKKEHRARPNVIFEFGYFVGRLGRSRVCCVFKKPVILPSDILGLIYKEVGGSIEPQAFSIIKELKAAGYNIKL